MHRLTYAFLGALFGALIGAICWWLYGLAFSRHYAGPGIDSNLLHWLKASAIIFGTIGLIFKDRVGTAIGTVVATIFNFEAGRHEETHLARWQIVLVLLLIAGAAWYFLRG
jgi:branched-subunit amino acid ABC-type transport system permease component